MDFRLTSPFPPTGDQPAAIDTLTENLREGMPFQTLLGVTGSGKTFTLASTIARVNRPTLIISHNKTLAAQLYQEFRAFFPDNAVHYFVSYYDYYQPEAYVPQTDTYIEKDAKINELIDRLRHAATEAILSRRDVIVIASVSCIYGLGMPESYAEASVRLARGARISQHAVLTRLAELQFTRNDLAPLPGTYRARGEVVEVRPMTGLETVRLEWHGSVLERIAVLEHRGGGDARIREAEEARIFPAKHFVTAKETLAKAITNIRAELAERLKTLKAAGKLLEVQRLEQRTRYDLEMLKETGYCSGVENYSRHLEFRKPGTPPTTLLDYFAHAYGGGPETPQHERDWLLVIDESHMSVPQVRGMYNGDRARKETLIEYGFRLPSALDNRPLRFEEFLRRIPQALCASATPAAWELEQSGGRGTRGVVEQLIRPTGLLDPVVEVVPTEGQIARLEREIAAVVAKGQRALAVTITKRLAEELTDHLAEKGFKVQYLHSEVKTMDRPEILKDLRSGKFDVVVGINLLREGLDLPEVSLVAILDADKEGFLRNETTLVQTIGRAARHAEGRVLLFGDRVTDSMRRAIDETARRRTAQEAYNRAHGITPKGIVKDIASWEFSLQKEAVDPLKDFMRELLERDGYKDLPAVLKALEKEMKAAAKDLDFERAASIRDQISALKKRR